MTQYFFSATAISILVISNHNSFRVLFDKIASVYFILKNVRFLISILALEMASPGNRHCAKCIGTLSFAIVLRDGVLRLISSRSWYGHVLRKDDDDWVKKCMEYEVEGPRPRGRPKRT